MPNLYDQTILLAKIAAQYQSRQMGNGSFEPFDVEQLVQDLDLTKTEILAVVEENDDILSLNDVGQIRSISGFGRNIG